MGHHFDAVGLEAGVGSLRVNPGEEARRWGDAGGPDTPNLIGLGQGYVGDRVPMV